MPNDITGLPISTWASTLLLQAETWQCQTGKMRISRDAPPASLDNGIILEPLMGVELNGGETIYYRAISATPVTIGRIKR